ncbi:MAG: ATP-binding cassette domain-containing protein [Coriobacteriia bacterium]|nr:ATP-binding cassette domain-containing protein [Coriobacteriia bacterium]
MLTMSGASVGYPGHTVAAGLNLSVRAGEVIALVAPNGQGKTTLLMALAGRPQTLQCGTVEVDGVPSGRFAEFSRRVWYASSEASLLEPQMTLRFHLETIRELWGSDAEPDDLTARTGSSELLDLRIAKMSQGMRQAATITCALATGADYLLFDEPLNGLDPLRAREMLGLFSDLAAEGRAILVSSHIFNELEDIADRLLLLTPNGLESRPTGLDWRQLFLETYGKEGGHLPGIAPPKNKPKAKHLRTHN